MQATLEEVQNLASKLTFIDKLRLLEFLAPLISRSAPNSVAPTSSEFLSSDELPSPTYSVDPNRAVMKQEIDAYHQMHPELVKSYLNKYVSIYQGRLIDHDMDPVALHKRIKMKYSNKVVLSRQVAPNPERIINMRSPRLERVS